MRQSEGKKRLEALIEECTIHRDRLREEVSACDAKLVAYQDAFGCFEREIASDEQENSKCQ